MTDFGPIIYFRENRGKDGAPRAALRGNGVNDSKWLKLSDDALEKLLIERWLYRGVLLVLMLAAALLTTYLGTEGLRTAAERLTIAGLVCITLGAGAALFVMRATDIRMHRELRGRRRRAGVAD